MNQSVPVKRGARGPQWLSGSLMKIPRAALLLGVLWPLAGTGEETSPPALQVELEGEYLTIEAAQVPHREIMQAVAKALELELVLNAPFDDPRSLSVRHVPWQEGLEKALSPTNWAIVYDHSTEPRRVTKVIVLNTGGLNPAPPKIDSRARLPATAKSDADAKSLEEFHQEVVAQFEANAGMSVEEIEQLTTTLFGLEEGHVNLREMLQNLEPEELEKVLQVPEPEDLENLPLK